MTDAPPLVELRSVSKSFGPTRALSEVSFELGAGEVHVLSGENGAGKSTLIRVIAGVVSDFEGELFVSGRAVRFRRPAEAARAGIATIHQELSLIRSMSVVDNLFLGETSSLLAGYSSAHRLARAREVLSELELDVDPLAGVETLPLSLRQLVEIARALAQDARVIVMDEPTSALSEPEAERLFSHVERLRAAGRGIVYISHRMEEIFRLADRITVLRDGRRVLTCKRDDIDPDTLVRAMVGRELAGRSAEPEPAREGPLLEVQGLELDAARGGRRLLEGVSFELHAGEVLGVAGLQGAGSSELLHAIYGSYGHRVRGKLKLGGLRFDPVSPERSLALGVTLLASDRRETVFPELSIRANASLSSLAECSRAGFIDVAEERERASAMARSLAIAAPSVEVAAGRLSGGNQQKVALARCLLAKPKLLLLDDPTRGIDVGATADVHALVRRVASEGTGVLLVASELDELFALCHRVMVLSRGRVTAILERAELERARVLSLCMSQAKVSA